VEQKMDKDIMKFLTMIKLRYGNGEFGHAEIVDFKNTVFPKGYRTDTVAGMVNTCMNLGMLKRIHDFHMQYRLSDEALKLIEENENGV
jgi:hypothetical protein